MIKRLLRQVPVVGAGLSYVSLVVGLFARVSHNLIIESAGLLVFHVLCWIVMENNNR